MQNGVSKKVTVSMAAISAIAASEDFRAQIVIACVAAVAMIVQGWLDYGRKPSDPQE